MKAAWDRAEEYYRSNDEERLRRLKKMEFGKNIKTPSEVK